MALDARDMEVLRLQREQLNEAVLDPLQRIKTTIGRCLQRTEVREIKSMLTQEIRNDTLAKINDGETLVAVLDMYYGRDNLKFLERLLNKTDCHDLIEMLHDWKNTGSSLNPSLFEEFGYFPLWIKVNATFTEFSSHKKQILSTLKDVFAIPVLDENDPELDPLVLMGVSLGKQDVLFCALIPECVRQHIKVSLQYREVVGMLEDVNVSGIYFSRRKHGTSGDDYRRLSSSRSSLSSGIGSVMSDFGLLGDAVFEVSTQEKETPVKERDYGGRIFYTTYKKEEKKPETFEKISDRYIEDYDRGFESTPPAYGVVRSFKPDLLPMKEKPEKEKYGSCFFIDHRRPNQVSQQILLSKEGGWKKVEKEQMIESVDKSLQSQYSDYSCKLPQPEPESPRYQDSYFPPIDQWEKDAETRQTTEAKYYPQGSQSVESTPPEQRPGSDTTGKPNQSEYASNSLPSSPPYMERDEQIRPSLYMQYRGDRVNVREGNPRQSIIFMHEENGSQLGQRSDTQDGAFPNGSSRRLDSQGERGSVKFDITPPPYRPPPGYEDSLKRKSQMSLGSLSSIDSRGSRRGFRSPLLSAHSISSIYREKEMFLSTDELNESIKSAEEREWEKYYVRSRDLLTAAKIGDDNEVNSLLEYGVDVNYQNEFGHTALMMASRGGHHKVVQTLIAADADVNAQEKYGKSALHEAAWSGQHRVIHALVSADADINILDEQHRTPLQYATLRGKKRVVEELLLMGADVSIKNAVGESAIEIAYWTGHRDIVKLILSSTDKIKRKEMKGQIRRQKIERIKSATSLPNLNKSISLKDLARSRSRPDLNKNSACVIQ